MACLSTSYASFSLSKLSFSFFSLYYFDEATSLEVTMMESHTQRDAISGRNSLTGCMNQAAGLEQ
jgi:hypothetical protein